MTNKGYKRQKRELPLLIWICTVKQTGIPYVRDALKDDTVTEETICVGTNRHRLIRKGEDRFREIACN